MNSKFALVLGLISSSSAFGATIREIHCYSRVHEEQSGPALIRFQVGETDSNGYVKPIKLESGEFLRMGAQYSSTFTDGKVFLNDQNSKLRMKLIPDYYGPGPAINDLELEVDFKKRLPNSIEFQAWARGSYHHKDENGRSSTVSFVESLVCRQENHKISG